MVRIASTLHTLVVALKAELATRMAYRGDFFLSATMTLVVEAISPAVTYLVYEAGASFPGWSLHEALLIQGIFMLSRGIAFPFFFGMVWNTLGRVREGTFDLLLIKPQSALVMAMVTGVDSNSASRAVSGLVISTIALANLPSPQPAQWAQFAALFVLSLSVLLSFCLFMSGTLFVWVANTRVYEIFDAVTALGRYPKSIYSKSIQTFISLVTPVAMIGFFPAAALLGKPTEGLLVTCAVCVAFLGLGLVYWHDMLGRYTSAGG